MPHQESAGKTDLMLLYPNLLLPHSCSIWNISCLIAGLRHREVGAILISACHKSMALHPSARSLISSLGSLTGVVCCCLGNILVKSWFSVVFLWQCCFHIERRLDLNNEYETNQHLVFCLCASSMLMFFTKNQILLPFLEKGGLQLWKLHWADEGRSPTLCKEKEIAFVGRGQVPQSKHFCPHQKLPSIAVAATINASLTYCSTYLCGDHQLNW